MKTKLCSVIIVSPANPRIWKIQISRQAIGILFVAFLLSFFITVLTTAHFPEQKLSEAERIRLESENRALQIENKNAEIRTRRLDAEISRLEDASKRISTLVRDE